MQMSSYCRPWRRIQRLLPAAGGEHVLWSTAWGQLDSACLTWCVLGQDICDNMWMGPRTVCALYSSTDHWSQLNIIQGVIPKSATESETTSCLHMEGNVKMLLLFYLYTYIYVYVCVFIYWLLAWILGMSITHKYTTTTQTTRVGLFDVNPLDAPSPSLLYTSLTLDSPVCFISCLADGPEISPQQEEGAVPTYPVSSLHTAEHSACLSSAWLFVSVHVCLWITAPPIPYVSPLCPPRRAAILTHCCPFPESSFLYCWGIYSFRLWNFFFSTTFILLTCCGWNAFCWMQETRETLWGLHRVCGCIPCALPLCCDPVCSDTVYDTNIHSLVC